MSVFTGGEACVMVILPTGDVQYHTPDARTVSDMVKELEEINGTPWLGS